MLPYRLREIDGAGHGESPSVSEQSFGPCVSRDSLGRTVR